MKGAIGASCVFLGAAGMGVSETVALAALGIAVSLRRFLDFDPLWAEEEGGEGDGNLVRVNRDNNAVACLANLAVRSLLRYRAEPIVTA